MTQTKFDYKYTGQKQPPTDLNAGKIVRDSVGREYYPYIATEDLVRAINLAIDLNRPLLIEGDPGCGKTQVAFSLAYELTKNNLAGQVDEEGNPTWWPFYRWDVKSISQARDGLYQFDTIGRLRDAQLVGLLSQGPQQLDKLLGKQVTEFKEKLQNPQKYIQYGPFGMALKEPEQRAVLLIDEIDKADRDFPNDLLRELDEKSYLINELLTEETCQHPPLIIITSNQERPLPTAFLRRCLYFYIESPGTEQLKKIVAQRFGIQPNKDQLVVKAIEEYERIRTLLTRKRANRPPSTSEFLDFLVALKGEPEKNAIAALKDLSQRHDLLGTLIKTRSDRVAFQPPTRDSNNG